MVGKGAWWKADYQMARLAASTREETSAEYHVPPRGQRRRRGAPLVTGWKRGHDTQTLASQGSVPLGTIAKLDSGLILSDRVYLCV